MNFFKTSALNGTLSHAYVFFGPPGVGKRTAAKAVAAELLKIPIENLMSHPDFIYAERTTDEKTEKLKKEISVSEARALRSRLQRTSWTSGYRVVVINEAELLSTEAASALLKMLEEPPQGCIFFLLVEDENALLTTIRSRVQPFYFTFVSPEKISKALREKGVSAEKADLFARRSLGRPGKAFSFLEAENETRYNELFEKFKSLIGAPFYLKLQLIENLYGDKEDGERGREEWQKILNQWIAWFRDWLLKKHGGAGFSSEPGIAASVNFSNAELVRIIDSLTNAKRLLKQNVHPRLTIEQAIINF